MKICRKRHFLFSVIILLTLTLAVSVAVYAASYWEIKPSNYVSWSGQASLHPSDGNEYYRITDIASYGANMTADYTLSSTHMYDSFHYYSPSRITYQKKIKLPYGTKINIAGFAPDTGAGGENATAYGRMGWVVMEWNASGGFLWDSGWLDSSQSYRIGMDQKGSSTGAGGVNCAAGKRDTVSYITLIFRSEYDKDLTPAQFANTYPNLYLCYKPFVYSFNGTNVKVERTGTEQVTLPYPDIAEREGYDKEWIVSSSSKLSPNWMHGNSYSKEELQVGLSGERFYNSLFGNVSFTGVHVPKKYKVSFVSNGGSFKDGNGNDIKTVTTVFERDEYWCINGYEAKRRGYSFKGFYSEPEGGVQVYDESLCAANDGMYFAGNKWIYPGDVTLYAQWEPKEYTLTYHANGGTVSTQSLIYHYQEEIDLSIEALKSGEEFIGWSKEANGRIPMDSMTMPDEDITLYAVYSIPVSDIANHTYPEYQEGKESEVFLRVWEKGNVSNYRDYPLTYMFDTKRMVYRYSLEETDVSDFVKEMEEYCYRVFAYDNAGNISILVEGGASPEDVIPERKQMYEQCIMHYRYDAAFEEWIWFETTTDSIEEGSFYKPEYLEVEPGYLAYQIKYPVECKVEENGSYKVTEASTLRAEYVPENYVLTFHSNGGSCHIKEKKVTYSGLYGVLPIPERKGYSFEGWYTEPEGGILIQPSDRYWIASDSVLYAHWTKNAYTVTYDYWTNGGTGASEEQRSYSYESLVDLTVQAEKEGAGLSGWRHIGWNTDPNAVEPLRTYTMPDEDVTLYAIYEKEIQLTLYEKAKEETYCRKHSARIYNNELYATFEIKQEKPWEGWNLLGWTMEKEANANPTVGNGAVIQISEGAEYYALYLREITISFDSNGSPVDLEEQTKEVFYNASGSYSYPFIILPKKLFLSDHSFVEWKVKEGMVQDEKGERIIASAAESKVKVMTDTCFVAVWDQYPSLEVYDRYFTLEEAKNGKITESVLLEKVIGTDKEDGVLEKGTDIRIKDFDERLFRECTEEKDIALTYQATDSFGNRTEETIQVRIVDASLKENPKKQYVRFISRDFFLDREEKMIPAERGGLEETSIWRKVESYWNLLYKTLMHPNEEGETWTFTKEEIQKIKQK